MLTDDLSRNKLSSLELEFVSEEKDDGINDILTRPSFLLSTSKHFIGDENLISFSLLRPPCTMDGFKIFW